MHNPGLSDAVRVLAVANDRLFSSSHDGIVKGWDVRSMESLQTLAYTGPVRTLILNKLYLRAGA